jgi:hypothetical protein
MHWGKAPDEREPRSEDRRSTPRSPARTGKHEPSAAHHSKGAQDASNENRWEFLLFGSFKTKGKRQGQKETRMKTKAIGQVAVGWTLEFAFRNQPMESSILDECTSE